MSKYKGKIKNFPKEIVEKMLERQVEQDNKRDVTVFEECRIAAKEQGGFTWGDTLENHHFWNDVIIYEKFHVFFEKYPKQKFKAGDKVKIAKIPEKKGSCGLSEAFYEAALGKVKKETYNFKEGDRVIVYKLPDDTKDNRYMINLREDEFETFLGREFTITKIYLNSSYYAPHALLNYGAYLPLCSLKKVEEQSVEETVKSIVKEELDATIKAHYEKYRSIEEDFKVGDTVQLYKVPDSNDNGVLINLSKKWYNRNLGKVGKIINIAAKNGYAKDGTYYVKRASVTGLNAYVPLCALKKVQVEKEESSTYKTNGASIAGIFKGESEEKLPEIKIRNKKRIKIKL